MGYSWLDDNVEAYVDGDLSAADVDRFESALADDPDLQAAVAVAIRVREALAQLEMPACPDNVVFEALAVARSERSRPGIDRYLDVLARPRQRLRLTVVSIGAMAAVVVAFLLVSPNSPNTAEVEQGLADVKLALAYVGAAGRQAGDIVRIEVVEEGMVVPMRRAVQHATADRGARRSRPAFARESREHQKQETNDE